MKYYNKAQSLFFILFLLITVSQSEMVYAFNENNIYEQEKDYPLSINLFWIHEEKSLYEEYIFPLNKKTEIISTIIDWAIKNPHSTVIQLWYDKTLVSQHAIDNTLDLIKKCSEDNNLTTPILLKDVGTLLLVQQHKDILSTELPVYFRADLLRLIAIYQEITTENMLYAVYADLDMPPITHESLYDNETLFLLKKYGTVITGKKLDHRKNDVEYENNFQILSSHNKDFLNIMKKFLIDSNIEKISDIIVMAKNEYRGYRKSKAQMEQEVYASYEKAFKENFVVFEQNHYILNYLCTLNPLLNYLCTLTSLVEPIKKEEYCVPTKKIQMPRSHFGFGIGFYARDCIYKEEPEL